MALTIIDAHSHLWLRQDTSWNNMPIRTTHDGRSFFLTEEVQMLPPFMVDGRNTAEVFLSNMNYARVGGAVVVQELIDGPQNDYLAEVKRMYPERFEVFGLCDYFNGKPAEEAKALSARGFKGMAVPGHRLITDGKRVMLNSPEMMDMFHYMEDNGMILSVCLAEDNMQTAAFTNYRRELDHNGPVTFTFSSAAAAFILDEVKVTASVSTGIDNVMTVTGTDGIRPADNRIYSVDGRYVGTDDTKLGKGLYIRNGKKFIKR